MHDQNERSHAHHRWHRQQQHNKTVLSLSGPAGQVQLGMLEALVLQTGWGYIVRAWRGELRSCVCARSRARFASCLSAEVLLTAVTQRFWVERKTFFHSVKGNGGGSSVQCLSQLAPLDTVSSKTMTFCDYLFASIS